MGTFDQPPEGFVPLILKKKSHAPGVRVLVEAAQLDVILSDTLNQYEQQHGHLRRELMQTKSRAKASEAERDHLLDLLDRVSGAVSVPDELWPEVQQVLNKPDDWNDSSGKTDG